MITFERAEFNFAIFIADFVHFIASFVMSSKTILWTSFSSIIKWCYLQHLLIMEIFLWWFGWFIIYNDLKLNMFQLERYSYDCWCWQITVRLIKNFAKKQTLHDDFNIFWIQIEYDWFEIDDENNHQKSKQEWYSAKNS